MIQALLTLAMASQHRQLQLKAIQTIVLLAQNNRVCCNALIQAGAAKSLQTVLDQEWDSRLVEFARPILASYEVKVDEFF